MDDYFDAVRTQLDALCEARAHQRAWRQVPRPRLASSTGVVVISMVITAVVFLIAVGDFSSRSHQPASTHAEGTTAPDAIAQRALRTLDGIPQSGTILGDPRAPVRITFFADLQCPVCRAFTLGGAFRELVTDQVRSGRVSINFRSLCTTTCSGDSKRVFDAQQIAAYAAADQNLLWDYALLFFAQQRSGSGYVTPAYLNGLARQVPGLNLERWQKARGTPAVAARLGSDATIAQKGDVIATPTLVVAGANAHVILIGAATHRQLMTAIDKVKRARAVGSNAIVKACLSTGRLTRRYSNAQLRSALRSMPASVKRYTNCPNVISRALRGAR
jgi:protein-disulfide isomerase